MVAHIIAWRFVINICLCIPPIYAFNELQHEGFGAPTFRHAETTSDGCSKSNGQAALKKDIVYIKMNH